ncbi:zinc finger protein 708-like [Acyrthosiphon pisum]|uniref:C2H2-type domain-containing protein n=1 Tax=Acyrthosiphon pisum TaxID=7029 RepID=A0A8R1X1N7_ACYPI|nr:zinc finger protein 708-like [Acyrthosiphon pisum]|eukprot:XP_008180332.1 PREDICTED: zinc finger protein 708-like [Acyrthosiphon pisum]
MEPLSSSINDSAINSKYDYILNSSRVLTIPIVRCDDPVLNRFIKQEFIDEMDINNEHLLIRPKCEPEEEIYPTKIKTEMDLNEIVVFEGSVNNEFYPSELTTQIKLEETSNLRKRLSNSSDFQVNHRFQTNHNNKKCNISDKLSNSKALFTRHSKTHTTKRIKQFICDNCGKSYNTKSDLTTHILLCCTERKLYTSFICDKGVSQAGDLKKYRPKCEPEEEIYPTKIKTEMDLNEIVVFEGSVNNEFYPSELTTQIKLEETSNLRKRLSNSSDFQVNHRFQTNHNNKKCNISDKLSNSKALFTRHSKTHTTKRIKQFICDNCGKSYNTKSDLTTHILLCCTERKLYTSFICDKGVSQAGDLKKYKRPHTGIKSFKCDICDKGFSDPGYLRKHKITHTGIKPYMCDICKKGFAQKINIKIHLRTHTGDKSYECDICGKKYYQKSNLTTHLRGHTGYKPHECNICDKKFSQLGHLIRHTRTHTGDRPYKCDACDKGFYQLSDLKRHMMTHTGVKPYKCVTCDKRFAQSCGLKRHTYIHTGFKPHKCVYCDKRFIQSQELKKHILKHTREKPYACNICDKRFTQSGTLKNHKRTHTRVTETQL